MKSTNHNTSQEVICEQKMKMTVTNILPYHNTSDNVERKHKIETQLFQIFKKYV